MRQKCFSLAVPALVLALVLVLAPPPLRAQWQIPLQPPRAQQTPADREFFPVAVWCAGGKPRAPMTSRNPARERRQWLHDLQTISKRPNLAV